MRSCFIDGEAIFIDKTAWRCLTCPASASRPRDVLCVFDLIELDGEDLRACRSNSVRALWQNCYEAS